MANAGTVLTNLETEIRMALMALSPVAFGHIEIPTKFRMVKGADRANFREQTGQGRLFNIVWSSIKQRTIGSSTRTFDVTGSIIVGYPLSGSDTVRVYDYQLICDTMNDTASTVTGVCYRLVDVDAEPETDEREDWLFHNIPLKAVIETTR